MSRKARGYRVSFPADPTDREAQTVTSTCRFTVPFLERDKPVTILVDLSTWSRARLARAFAVALRDHLLSPRTVCTRKLISQRIAELRRFWQYLDATQADVDDVADMTPELIDRYERWLEQKIGGPYRRELLSRSLRWLRLIEERRPGTLSAAMVDRLAYVSLEPKDRSTPRDAYSDAIASSIRRAARAQILAAAARIAPDGTLPAMPEGLHTHVYKHFREVFLEIERLGWLPTRRSAFERLRNLAKYWNTEASPPIRWETVHAPFYLTAVDVGAFLALLALETGLEIECLTGLKMDCLKNPRKGTVEIEYCKRRARGAEWKRLRVRDGGVNTPGGLIRLASRLSARARRHKETNALWLHVCVLGFVDGARQAKNLGRLFVRHHALVGDDGRALHLVFARLRKTQKAEWYLKTQGQINEFAVGHTPEVAATHYADIPALRHVHEQTVADALQDALDDALKPKIVLPAEEVAIRADPLNTPLPVPPQEVIAFLEGAQDLWLASCSGFYDSPFGAKGAACPVPFWGCLECVNAVITSRKLPALIAFLNFITAQRETLCAADWSAKFARAHRRIAEQILPAFPEADVLAARAIAQTTQNALYLPPEALAR